MLILRGGNVYRFHRCVHSLLSCLMQPGEEFLLKNGFTRRAVVDLFAKGESENVSLNSL